MVIDQHHVAGDLRGIVDLEHIGSAGVFLQRVEGWPKAEVRSVTLVRPKVAVGGRVVVESLRKLVQDRSRLFDFSLGLG